jgi:hypothetical protein
MSRMKKERCARWNAFIAVAAITGAFLMGACSRAAERDSREAFGYAPAGKPMGGESFSLSLNETGTASKMKDAPAPEPGRGDTAADGTGAAGKAQAINASRKLVKTGAVSVEARDMAEAEASARAIAERLGGYVSSSNDYQYSLAMTIRVPQAKFDEAMKGAAGLGRVLSRSESVEDVSLRYADLESRIESKKILRERYETYLRGAKKVDDLLAIERSLNDVLSELDAFETQFRVLADQVDYATLSFGASLPPEALPASERSFLGGLSRIWDAFRGFLYFLGFALVALVLFGVPAVLLLGLLYWLCFGKIGAVRKFFVLLSGRRKGKRAT